MKAISAQLYRGCTYKAMWPDPQRTWSLKDRSVLGAVLPILTTATIVSLSSPVVPTCVKNAIISPLLKRRGLDPDDLRSSRPISNLPFIGVSHAGIRVETTSLYNL